MKNNTKVRLHLSKKLFESLTREIIKEAKANGGGAYTEEVKMPPVPSSKPKMPPVPSSKPKMPPVPSSKPKMPPVPPAGPDKPSQYKKPAMPPVPGQVKEMEMNVAEEGQLNEIDPATSWEAIAAGMAAIGLAPLAIDKFHKWWEKKHPESFKKAQGISAQMDKTVGGNTPGQGHGVDTSKTFGPQNEEDTINEFIGTETPDSGMITALATLLGVGVPLAAGLIKHLKQAKTPEEKKQILQKELPGKDR